MIVGIKWLEADLRKLLILAHMPDSEVNARPTTCLGSAEPCKCGVCLEYQSEAGN